MLNVEYSFDLNQINPRDLKSAFERFGIVHVRSVLSPSNITYFKSVMTATLQAALKLHNIETPSEEDDLDHLYNRLFAEASVSDFWRFVPKTLTKNSLVFHRLLCEPGILQIAEHLIGHNKFQLNWDQNIFRVDRPEEGFSGFDWHQDHPYILLSKSAVSVWSPLMDITPDMGPLTFVPESHKTPFYPVVLSNDDDYRADDYQSKSSKHRYMDMADRASLTDAFERKAVQLPMTAGDALFFHSHLVHRSGHNQSSRSRWVSVARYGDLLDPDVIQRGWRTTKGADTKLVQELYPDQVIERPSSE